MENSEMIKKANEFRNWFAQEYSDYISEIGMPANENETGFGFEVVLDEGIDAPDFVNSIMQTVDDRIDFKFPIVIWVNDFDRSTEVEMPYNYEYDGYDPDLKYDQPEDDGTI